MKHSTKSKEKAPGRPGQGGLGSLIAAAAAQQGGGQPMPPDMGAVPPAGPPMGGPPPMGMKKGGEVRKYGQPKEDLHKKQSNRPAHVFSGDGGNVKTEKATESGELKYKHGGRVDGLGTMRVGKVGGHMGHGTAVHGGGKDTHHLKKSHGDHVKHESGFHDDPRLHNQKTHGGMGGKLKFAEGGRVDGFGTMRVGKVGGSMGHGTAVHGGGRDEEHLKKAHSDHVREECGFDDDPRLHMRKTSGGMDGAFKYAHGGAVKKPHGPPGVKEESGKELMDPGENVYKRGGKTHAKHHYAKGGHVKGFPHGIEQRGKTRGRVI